jgi:hypothetical protein
MAESTPLHDTTPVTQQDAGPTSDGAAGAERFTLSFQIPQLRFVSMKAATLEKQLRKVAKEAMAQTEKQRCEKPVGMRVHLQFATTNPEGAPPEQLHQIAYTFVSAVRGIVFNSVGNVTQLLITKAWGEFDGVSVTVWEIK